MPQPNLLHHRRLARKGASCPLDDAIILNQWTYEWHKMVSYAYMKCSVISCDHHSAENPCYDHGCLIQKT